MITFIIINSILILKLFGIFFLNVLLIPNILAKIILIILLLLLLLLLYTYPRNRFNKLSALRFYRLTSISKYALNTLWEHFYNLFILITYCCLFITGIFYLRLSNIDKKINLLDYYDTLKIFINKTTLMDLLMNITIFILFFIVYISFFVKISNYFKFHLIKRHLFMINNVNYQEQILIKFLHKVYIENVYYLLCHMIKKAYEKYYNKKDHQKYNNLTEKEKIAFDMQKPIHPYYFFKKYKKGLILYYILTKGHYLLLFILLIYDLCTSFQITKIFYILPWTFIYDIYVRMSKFINDLNLPYDIIIHSFLYHTTLSLWDNKTMIIDGEFYDLKYFRHIYETYILKNFIKNPLTI